MFTALKNENQQHISETMLWTIHRAHCEHFSLELLSTLEIVPVTSVMIIGMEAEISIC